MKGNRLGTGLLGVVVGLVVAWGVGGRGSSAVAANPGTGVESAGTIAFTSGNPGQLQQLYIINTRTQSFAIYSIDGTGGNKAGVVKLEAARRYEFDLKLAEYNNQQPEVAAIEGMVGGKK